MKTKSAYLVYGIVVGILFLLSLGMSIWLLSKYVLVAADQNIVTIANKLVLSVSAAVYGIIVFFLGFQFFVFVRTIRSEKSQYLSEHGIEQLVKSVTIPLIGAVFFAPIIIFIAVSSVTISTVGDSVKQFMGGFTSNITPSNTANQSSNSTSSLFGSSSSSTKFNSFPNSSRSSNGSSFSFKFIPPPDTSQSNSRQSSSAFSTFRN